MSQPPLPEVDEAQSLAVASSMPRRRELDGIRGFAIVLVVLSHGWIIWLEKREQLAEHRVVGAWFASGNYGVSIFFVVGAFLATRAMITARDGSRGLDPVLVTLRRFVRLTGQVAFLVLVVLVVTTLDDSKTYGAAETRTSVLHILTYTWNWYLQAHALSARPDLGNLWYLSVDMQVFLLVLALVYMLRRQPRVLPVTLLALLVASVAWKVHVYEVEGDVQALLRTTSRMDAPLTGALVATLLAYAGGLRRAAPALAGLGVLAMIPLLYLNDTNAAYFSWPGQVLNVALAAIVLGLGLAPASTFVHAVLAVPPLAFLGRHSLSIFIWHYPLFFFLSRHSADWNWVVRSTVALVLLMVFALASEWMVERRVQALLDSRGWERLEAGLPALAVSAAGSVWDRRPRRRRSSEPARHKDVSGGAGG